MASPPSPLGIRRARSAEDYLSFKHLTLQYYDWLGEDLCFQGISEELDRLPGSYAEPHGCILLASVQPEGPEERKPIDVGIVAIRPLPTAGGGTCEMKRLWVAPSHRGRGAGRRLVVAAARAAAEAGHARVVLDTLERLAAANRLYQQLGFSRAGAYYHNPLPGVVYWSLELPAARLPFDE